MSEFGHHYGSFKHGRIDAWGAGPFVKSGETLKDDVPGERSPFWPHYHKWRELGRRLADDGQTCVYDAPKPGIYTKNARGQRFVVTQNGADLGAGWVEQP